MAGLLDLFSGRSSDLYGGALTPEQRGGMGNIGLLALAGKLGQLAGPSFSPVPDFGAAIGQAAGAYGASQEGAGTAALNAILTGLKGQDLQSQLAIRKQVLGLLPSLLPGDGAGGGTAATPETGSTGGGAAAPLSAGGDVGSLSDPRGMVPHIQAEATRLGIDIPTALKVAGSEGLAKFFGDGGKSGGAFQLYTGGGMGNDFQRDTGLDPLDPKNEKATITYALERAAKEGWGAWNGAKKLGITGFAGIGKPGAAPTAAAPDGVRVPYYYGAPAAAAPALNVGERATPLSPGGGLPSFTTGRAGLLGGTADAGDTSTPADVLPNRVGRFAGVAPGTPVNSRGFPYNPEITDPAVAARVAQSMAAIKQAQQSGVPWAATRETSGSSTDPIMSVTSADQAGGGDAPGGLASGLLTRGGPLTRGVPGMPSMPPAAAPSADPSLQLGPLAAPAPAAAAPAAPGPGLLSPPRGLLAPPAAALPAVPAAPNINPRALAAAGVLSQLGGLPDIFKPLENFYYQSPGYKGQVATAEAAAKSPFEIMLQDRTSANALRNALIEAGWGFDKDGNAVQIPGYNTVAEAKARSIALGTGEGQKPLELAKIQANLQADLLKSGQQLVIGMDGKPAVVPLPGAAEAAANAARLKAEATPTPEAQNYGDYVKDAQMRNQPVLSRLDWERTKGSQDPAYLGRIAFDQKVAEPIMASAVAGMQTRPILDEVVRLAYQTPEGLAGESGATMGKAMAALGFAPTERMSNAELMSAMQQRLIGPIREPGTSSDRDVTRYLAASPGLMSTGDGRVKMAEMTKALIDRNIELADVYRNNMGQLDLSQKLAAVRNKPLFTDEQRAAIEETIRTRGGTMPGGTAPATGVPGAASGAPPKIRDFNPATGTFGAPR